MELRNLSKNTQRYYLSAVIGLARYYQQSPDKLTQEMIEYYLLYLKNDKGNTPGTCATEVAGLLFQNGRKEGALMLVLIAVAATSRKRYPKSIISGDGQAFRKFASEEMSKYAPGWSENTKAEIEFHGK